LAGRRRDSLRGRARTVAPLTGPAAAARRRERARAPREPGLPFPCRLPDRGRSLRRPRRPRARARAEDRTVELTSEAIGRVVRAALAEDVGAGDRTTDGLVPEGTHCHADILIQEPGVVAGVDVARAVFRALDSDVQFDPL